jgi:hypothetical protein
MKWLRILAAVAIFLAGVYLGYSVRKTSSDSLQSIVAAVPHYVSNPAQIPGQIVNGITHVVTYPVAYRPGTEGKTKYRLGVITSLTDYKQIGVDQVTFSYRVYQRLWLDAGFDVKHRAALLGVSLEF